MSKDITILETFADICIYASIALFVSGALIAYFLGDETKSLGGALAVLALPVSAFGAFAAQEARHLIETKGRSGDE